MPHCKWGPTALAAGDAEATPTSPRWGRAPLRYESTHRRNSLHPSLGNILRGEEEGLLLRPVGTGANPIKEEREMRSRRRNWMLKRIALAFAVAAVAAPAAQARPLEPGATKAEFTPWVTDFGRDANVVPRGNTAPHGSTIEQQYTSRVDRIELARLQDRGKGAYLRSLD